MIATCPSVRLRRVTPRFGVARPEDVSTGAIEMRWNCPATQDLPRSARSGTFGESVRLARRVGRLAGAVSLAASLMATAPVPAGAADLEGGKRKA
jgi:hypothetical protein